MITDSIGWPDSGWISSMWITTPSSAAAPTMNTTASGKGSSSCDVAVTAK